MRPHVECSRRILLDYTGIVVLSFFLFSINPATAKPIESTWKKAIGYAPFLTIKYAHTICEMKLNDQPAILDAGLS